MKKLYDQNRHAQNARGGISKSIKLVAFMMLALTMSAYGNAASQSISLKLENSSLREALSLVMLQTETYFAFNEEAVASQSARLTMTIENKSLRETLTQIFNGLPFVLEYTDTTVIIKPTQRALQSQQSPPARMTISGTVTDVDGTPIGGVSVMLDGTKIGTSTSINGRYSISFSSRENAVLIFSSLGMKTEHRNCKDQTSINVIMNVSQVHIEEVVITGYQTLNARESASAVTQLKMEDIQLSGVSSLDKMLQGVIPGMMVLNTSGEPSAAPKIRIRGNATINGNKSPVWVVDGVIYEQAVPFTASDINSEDAEYLIGSAIAGLNPNDIELITVLKDASATAIYGVKAANGVVVITTKKGKEGPATIDYRGDVSFTERPNYRHYDRMNSQQRMQLSREIIDAGLYYPRIPSGDSYEGAYVDLINKKITQEEFSKVVNKLQSRNTDWYKELFRHSITHSHNLTVSGGGVGARYYFSTGYSDNQGTAKGSSSERFNVMGKIDVTVNKWFNFWANVSYNTTRNAGFFRTINPDDYAYKRSRTLPLYSEDGSYHMYNSTGSNAYKYNIQKELDETGSSTNIDELRTQLVMNIKLAEGLNYRGTFAYQTGNTKQQSWASDRSNYIANIRRYEYAEYDETHAEYLKSALPYGGIMTQNNNRRTQYTITNTLEYRRLFAKKHSVTAMTGIEARSNRYKGVNVNGYGWVPMFGEQFLPVYTESFISNYVQTGLVNPINTNTISQVASFFATASYSYDGRYVFNGNIRSDGSNKFGSDPKYRWLPTWSVAAKWNIINEAFLDDVAWLSDLGLRGSYGIRGNVHDDTTPNLIVRFGGRDAISSQEYYKIVRLPNPSLRWEKTHTWNAALELGLFDNRLRGSIDFYWDEIEDLIINKIVPTSNGRAALYMNAGNMTKRGIEGYFRYEIIREGDWRWNIGMTFGRNIEKITYANGDLFSGLEEIEKMIYGEMAVEGAPVGALYSFEFTGLAHETGHPLFRTLSGRDVHIGEPQLMKLVMSGSIFPKLYGGFDTHIGYKKNWMLDLGFAYNLGNVRRLPSVYEDKSYVFDPLTNVSSKLINRWKKPGDEGRTSIPALYDRDYIRGLMNISNESGLAEFRTGHNTESWLTTQLYDYSTAQVVKGDFFKLKTIGLTYILPQEFSEKLSVKSMRVKAQMMNVFTIANKKWEGLDPESSGANMPLRPYYTLAVGITF